eukprot:COSAG02_NODE_2175_length_9589_cov_6.644573_9_plen_39_part_01
MVVLVVVVVVLWLCWRCAVRDADPVPHLVAILDDPPGSV